MSDFPDLYDKSQYWVAYSPYVYSDEVLYMARSEKLLNHLLNGYVFGAENRRVNPRYYNARIVPPKGEKCETYET